MKSSMVVKKTTSSTIDENLTSSKVSRILISSQEAIDTFCDSCWLEDGLSKNSLSAYRRDLLLFARWLDAEHKKDIYEVDAADVMAYMAFRRADKATTANRRLTVLKRFYRLGIRNEERGITSGVHTPTFDIDEKALGIGPGLMAWLAVKELEACL